MLERRHHRGDCEIRTVSGKPVIAGYAAVFGKRSQDLGGFVEDIHAGAFERTLRTADVRALGNHDPNLLLGRSKSGTLKLGTDSGGLHYEIDPNMNDSAGRDAVARVERGDWDGSSFSFRTVGPNGDRWNYDNDPAQRTLMEVELYDVGPVTFPAYPDATANARAAVELLATRESRSVDELTQALQAGSLRTLLTQAVELPVVDEPEPEPEPEVDADAERALNEVLIARERIILRARQDGISLEGRAVSTTSANVAWGPEEGFNDLLCDIDDALNPSGWRYCTSDISLKLDKVLVYDWESPDEQGSWWVAGLEIGADNEPLVAPRLNWVNVASAFVVVDSGGRSLRNLLSRSKQLLRFPESRAEKRAGTGDPGGLVDQMNLIGQQFVLSTATDTATSIAMQEILSSLDELSELVSGTADAGDD